MLRRAFDCPCCLPRVPQYATRSIDRKREIGKSAWRARPFRSERRLKTVSRTNGGEGEGEGEGRTIDRGTSLESWPIFSTILSTGLAARGGGYCNVETRTSFESDSKRNDICSRLLPSIIKRRVEKYRIIGMILAEQCSERGRNRCTWPGAVFFGGSTGDTIQHKVATSVSAFPAMCSSSGRTTKGAGDDSVIFMGCRVLAARVGAEARQKRAHRVRSSRITRCRR